MQRTHRIPGLALSLALGLALGASTSGEPRQGGVEWNSRAAEHLLNRAGFGAIPEEIARALELGLDGCVEELLTTPADGAFEAEWYSFEGNRGGLASLGEADRKAAVRKMRGADQEQVRSYLEWWVERMLANEAPLVERMTLFWHGHFTSSQQDVKNSFEMIQQNQLLRAHALSSFADLLHAVARDPAMLEYLDNDVNHKAQPNENFARELMELFTLGEGQYSEQDVKEAARAFTGWTDANGTFRFQARDHDRGEKRLLGERGAFDGDDVIDILLAKPACARTLAGKILRYFEGVPPQEPRLARYAKLLRDHRYEVEPFLRTLFHDPDFYRSEIVGARVASPIDYLVGSARRAGVEPPAMLLLAGATLLGERLFFPPNVKGWEGGDSWITTSTLMQRGNLVGVLLGTVQLDDILSYDPLQDPELESLMDDPRMDEGDEAAEEAEETHETGTDAMDPPEVRRPAKSPLGIDGRRLKKLRWRPHPPIAGWLGAEAIASDAAVVDALLEKFLAIEPAADTRAELVGVLAAERAAHQLSLEALRSGAPESDELLALLAHRVLSLPEAQLH